MRRKELHARERGKRWHNHITGRGAEKRRRRDEAKRQRFRARLQARRDERREERTEKARQEAAA